MLAIGEYSIIKDRYENLPVLYYVYKGQQEDAKRCFRLTPDMIKFFSKKIGFPFPYEKYAQVCIADFMFGGMENTSATTLNDKRAVYGKRAEIDYQNTNLVAHELAHQWWGGLVNQRDGVSHWLQEGFATYFDALYQEYRYGKDEFMRVMDNNMQSYKNAESRQGKIPMVSKTTPFVYVKGASVLNMLRFILGESDFFKSIRLFAKRFAYGNAFTDDFIKVVNDVTGKDLNWFFDEWLFKAGYPTFEVKYNYNELKKLLDINVKQIHKTDSIVPIFRTPIDIEITTANEKILKRVEIEKQEHTFQFKLDSKPLNIIFDKGNWIVKDLRFDKTKEELLYQFKNAKDAYDRKAALVQLKKIIDEDDVFNAFCEAALKEPDWTVRIEAIDSVVVFSRKEGIDLLLKALNDPKSDVRIASINNLRYIRGEVVSDALIKVIKNDSSYYAVSYALMALAIIDSIKAFDVIAPFAKMDSFRDLLKLGAITAFEIINTAKAIPYLIELSKSNESFNIRERAISALAAIRGNNERTIEFLKTLFIDPNEKIRLRVFQTIAIIGTKNIVPVLEEREKLEMNLEVKEQIKKSISEIDK
jgi:aminopeptidase N